MAQPLLVELLGALPEPAVLIGASQRIEAVNAAAEALLGQQLVGRHYIIGLRQPALAEAVEATLADGASRAAPFLGRKDGQDTTWAAHARRAGDWVLVSFEDRTLAEEAGQMRRDFVANVSHELKTPLTAMTGFIETLRGPARNDPAARERFLATMDREAQRMNRLVSDLLSLSRVEANERVRPREEMDLAMVIRSVLVLLSPAATEAGATLVFDEADAPVPIRGDPDQLRQVFSNLVENAIKYGGGRVEIHLTEEAPLRELRVPGVRIEVIDDGPGIGAAHLPRLTERFYRVDTHRAREVGGTGLGLAIVKHVVSRHRGRLRVVSARGRGSTFTVLLPRAP